MNRSRRWWITAAVLALLAGVIALNIGSWWINTFIHTTAFRHEVEKRAKQSLKAPVEIKQIDFSFWSGVKLEGVAAKLDTAQGTLAAQVESVNCAYSWLALLRGQLLLKAVTVTRPELVLTQEPPSTVPIPTPPVTAENAAAAKDESHSGKTAPFQFELRSLKVAEGHLFIRDATGATKAELRGMQVNASTAGEQVTGTLRIAIVALPQNLALTDFSTPFTYSTSAVEVGPFQADAFGGRLTGQYHLNPQGAPSDLSVQAERIDVAQVSRTASTESGHRLSGALALQSQWQGAETGKLTGQGNAQITGGKLTGVSILHDLATILRVPSLSDPDLKSVTTHFEVAGGTTHFNDLRIESEDFELTGGGVIQPAGGLDANMVLTLHGAAMGGIPGVAAGLFSAVPSGGGSIPLHIGGTVSNPRTNLSLSLPHVNVTKPLQSALKHLFH